MRLLLFFLLLALALSGCYEDVEGCLDVNGLNYDLDADDACPSNDCCTYPTVGLLLSHRYNGAALRTDTFYRDAAGQAFRLRRLRYYWSALSLELADGRLLVPQDTLTTAQRGVVAGDTVSAPLNYNLALLGSTVTAVRTFGRIRESAPVAALLGQRGLEPAYQAVLPGSLVADNPLSFQEGRLYYGPDTGYVQLKLEYDLVLGTDTVARTVNVFGSSPLRLPLLGITAVPRGLNLLFVVEAEVAALLAGLNLSSTEVTLAAALRAVPAENVWTVAEIQATGQ